MHVDAHLPAVKDNYRRVPTRELLTQDQTEHRPSIEGSPDRLDRGRCSPSIRSFPSANCLCEIQSYAAEPWTGSDLFDHSATQARLGSCLDEPGYGGGEFSALVFLEEVSSVCDGHRGMPCGTGDFRAEYRIGAPGDGV